MWCAMRRGGASTAQSISAAFGGKRRYPRSTASLSISVSTLRSRFYPPEAETVSRDRPTEAETVSRDRSIRNLSLASACKGCVAENCGAFESHAIRKFREEMLAAIRIDTTAEHSELTAVILASCW